MVTSALLGTFPAPASPASAVATTAAAPLPPKVSQVAAVAPVQQTVAPASYKQQYLPAFDWGATSKAGLDLTLWVNNSDVQVRL